MYMGYMRLKNFKYGLFGYVAVAFAAVAVAVAFAACSSRGNSEGDSDSAAESSEYHADNDIAMTIRSLADAISVNEPLDSAQYDFRGVLTDGTGRPLYTDILGAPGEWEVSVIDSDRAVIRNLYLGDLLPDELTQYILTSLNVPDSALVASSGAVEAASLLRIYDYGNAELIFETKEAYTEDGEKGPLLNIAIRKK